MARKPTISTSIDSDTLTRLEAHVAAQGISKAAFIRDLINAALTAPAPAPTYSAAQLTLFTNTFKNPNGSIVDVPAIITKFGTVAKAWAAFSEYKDLIQAHNNVPGNKAIKLNGWHKGINNASDFLATVYDQMFVTVSKHGRRTWFSIHCYPSSYGVTAHGQNLKTHKTLTAAFNPDDNTVFNNSALFEEVTTLLNEAWANWTQRYEAHMAAKAAEEAEARQRSQQYYAAYKAKADNLEFTDPVTKVTTRINSRSQWKELAKLYHPDINKTDAAPEAMTRLNEIRELMIKRQLWA